MSGSNQSQQLLTKATALYHSGDYRQAIQIWQEVLSLDPKNQRALEGIRMASLLLDEAQASEIAPQSMADAAASETPEGIAKVREGIQKVREFLSLAKYLDAMEICQALLQLAPRSEAVREVLEEARDAYEAQPFIDEHLEIARQLFVQERLDEASAEIQKVFFLSANHGEAKKLEAKIQALRQKQSTGAAESEPAPTSSSSTGEDMQQFRMPAALGETLDLTPDSRKSSADSRPAKQPDAGALRLDAIARSRNEEPALNEDWEAELAQIGLEPAATSGTATEEKGAREVEPEPMPLTDLSEDSAFALSHGPSLPARRQEAGGSEKPAPEVDFSDLEADLLKRVRDTVVADLERRPRQARVEHSAERSRPSRPEAHSPTRRGLPLGKSTLAFLTLALLLAGGWWMLGGRPTSASGQGGSPGAPPSGHPPMKRAAANPAPTGGPSNVGLSSNTSRPANTASAQSAATVLPGSSVPPAVTSPEEVKREVAGLFATGKSQMAHSQYEQAVETFSKILDLDAANLEAKENLDAAAGRVLEQKKLEEDLQTGKQFFVEKDYESALRKFYRLPKDRNLGEVDLFIRNAWFNYAVVSLKGGNCIEALQRLEEDLNLNPDDEEAAKLKEVAEHYRDRPKDKVFYAYVDRLTYRTLNQR